jgi:hypothetical protein
MEEQATIISYVLVILSGVARFTKILIFTKNSAYRQKNPLGKV